MSPTTVAISGGTSFTALHIALALKRAGFSVVVLCRGDVASYSGLKRERLAVLAGSQIEVIGNLRAERGDLARWIAHARPEIWVHHHHPMAQYRSAEYSLADARTQALDPLPEIVRSLKHAETRGIVYSGTYFEGSSSPYAQSKVATSNTLSALCEEAGLLFSKVLIPSPTGPMEDADRIAPLVIRYAREQKILELRSPDTVMDMIPGAALGEVYVEVIEQLLAGQATVVRPSCWPVTVAEWAHEARRELGLSLELRSAANPDAPVKFLNPEAERISKDRRAFWEEYRLRLNWDTTLGNKLE